MRLLRTKEPYPLLTIVYSIRYLWDIYTEIWKYVLQYFDTAYILSQVKITRRLFKGRV